MLKERQRKLLRLLPWLFHKLPQQLPQLWKLLEQLMKLLQQLLKQCQQLMGVLQDLLKQSQHLLTQLQQLPKQWRQLLKLFRNQLKTHHQLVTACGWIEWTVSKPRDQMGWPRGARRGVDWYSLMLRRRGTLFGGVPHSHGP